MQRVLIFGATSAIAAEFAQIHSRRGNALHLLGRNPEKLSQVVRQCDGARVSSHPADFSELAANAERVQEAIAVLGGVDIALIAHGDLGDQLESERSFAEAEAIFRVNLLSVVALLIPLANHMQAQRRGSVGVLTSVAGDRGRPRNYTYGAAKGALNIYLQGLRSRLHPAGVRVTTLKLGPVDTPMTRDHDKHLLFGTAASVAKGIVRAMDAGESEAYVPSFWGAIMPLVRSTPESLFQKLPFLSGR